ncbi:MULTISPECIES: UvrD-helicase domain-containing protein [unclassified Saccharopolyspora]|uniref:UvrD-helicase domain-containing protein n=1 Tax=unclassified Saccharopolyspora TaxID=2646250 RepID=UPI001CD458DC|nr:MULTISPECIES: UvrD-helicase domain-containing protein [unclassified Saccharopolyspora]MCA1189875.1 AAA family ATPase [Saccharopolyspora sp. 6T]MCA1194364.1 AAA family ATPase [Saccharopolyspora sp. 6V]MCA1229534.1 AAA family ATPase [Saccharopolyspora sp. 6M]
MSTDHRGEKLRRAAERAVAAYPSLASWQRQVLARFLVEGRGGWRTHVHTAFPDVPAGHPDALLIGPLGVLAVLVRDAEPEPGEVRAALRHATEPFIGVRTSAGVVSESVVRPVVVLPAGAEPSKRSAGHHLVVTGATLDRVLRKGERRLTGRDVESLLGRLGESAFLPLVPRQDTAPAGAGAELFDLDDLAKDRFDAVLDGPFESWLTFLDDSQHAMVRRDYSGPARISGPAGTGKSVVALHRLVRMARNSVGPLLFTTFASNLPPIAQRSFHRLAPELDGRVRFDHLHRWAREFLRSRGNELPVKSSADCFSRAWSKFGKHTRLAELNRHEYWRDEIDRVIKGRGITALAEYQGLHRTGRGLRLTAADRELVWRLHEHYEQIRRERGLHDHNDVFTEACAELEREPLERPLAGVVVDEVQDITLVGLRLVHALAGDGPNRLLLVGDGQQQIYAGGWRLVDAGIPIRGRGEVLRTNYRNASRILEWAQRFDATNQVDDLDGAPGFSLRESVATYHGGDVVPWKDPERLEDALVAAVRDRPEPDDVAVLTFEKSAADRWRDVLRRNGIPVRNLDGWAGERDGRVSVGTVHRAKGLEFREVFVPELPAEDGDDDRDRDLRELAQRARLVALTRARDLLWVGPPRAAG